jgi:hypothetical protein
MAGWMRSTAPMPDAKKIAVPFLVIERHRSTKRAESLLTVHAEAK